MEPRLSQPRPRRTRRRRQSLSFQHRRDSARYGRICLALPDHAGRNLGLHRHAAHRPGRYRDRRAQPAGADAGAQERLFLRARPRDGRVHFGRALYSAQLVDRDERGWPPADESRNADRHHRPARAGDAGAAGRAQLAPDGVPPGREPGLYPRIRSRDALCARGRLEARPRARVQHRLRSGRGRSAARSGHPPRSAGHDQGQAGRVGPGGAGSALERRASRAVERRPAGDRRRAGFPGQFGQRVCRL